MSTEILVYADWEPLAGPTLVGTLWGDVLAGREHFRFSYDPAWLTSDQVFQIDPVLRLYAGDHHGESGRNFRCFLDSCPDRWGRLLMSRREAIHARQQGRKPRALYEVDYLLGVHDCYRQGALRFKRDPAGPFLDDDKRLAAPPMARLHELENAARHVEDSDTQDDNEYLAWLNMLMSPGSSLGGARPKASVVAEDGSLWIAKFPSRHDDHDVGAWEHVTCLLAKEAGIMMPPSRMERFGSEYHTFLTQRFDRRSSRRMHFSSALTQLERYDGDDGASYLELAEFLTNQGADTRTDLAQLFRRIVFSIAVSNVDDHLRNHGFLLDAAGWRLSPAYDINPTTPATGLHLNIDMNDNSLDFELAISVAEYFQLSTSAARNIRDEVVRAVADWQTVARQAGISTGARQAMAPAFNV